jgi:hypothetical protein
MLPSHARDDVVEMTWPRLDVDVKSCWRQCCRGDLATMQCRCRVMLATMLSSPARDDATEVTWPRRDVDVMLATMLLSHARDDAAEVTWPRSDVDAESCR